MPGNSNVFNLNQPKLIRAFKSLASFVLILDGQWTLNAITKPRILYLRLIWRVDFLQQNFSTKWFGNARIIFTCLLVVQTVVMIR